MLKRKPRRWRRCEAERAMLRMKRAHGTGRIARATAGGARRALPCTVGVVEVMRWEGQAGSLSDVDSRDGYPPGGGLVSALFRSWYALMKWRRERE